MFFNTFHPHTAFFERVKRYALLMIHALRWGMF